MTARLTELERALKIKKTELSIEKDNESSIHSHQTDLIDRQHELAAEVRKLEEKQRKVSPH